MKRHLRVFLAGALVVVPFAITVYAVWWLAAWLGGLGAALLTNLHVLGTLNQEWVFQRDSHGQLTENVTWIVRLAGGVIVIAGIYFLGLLTHFWLFRKVVERMERWISRVPGVKTIYESVRDLMKLFGADSSRMGRAVLYKAPGSDVCLLGILTNESPVGDAVAGENLVALYLPFSYMFGGPTILVSREHVRDAGIPVDQALKLCATAHVTGTASSPMAAVASAKMRAMAGKIPD